MSVESIRAESELFDAGYEAAFGEVLELLDAEISKSRERGDLTTAETIEMLRAKVKARSLK